MRLQINMSVLKSWMLILWILRALTVLDFQGSVTGILTEKWTAKWSDKPPVTYALVSRTQE